MSKQPRSPFSEYPNSPSSRFYAPWCGHCQNLKPKYEKAAKGLKDLAQVAAVDCDAENNKALCASQGVKGFPTLKIVRPSKKPGKPTVEDYQGARESSDIIDAVKRAIPNNVKRIADKGLTAWLDADNSTTKAILFSDKSVTSALTKVLANDFVGNLIFAQIRNKEAAANEMFGVTEYPTLMILPGGTQEPVVYDGAFTKSAMKDFLSQHASPTDAKPLKEKIKEKAQKVVGKDNKDEEPAKPAEKEDSSFSSASSSQKATETSADEPAATAETLEDDSNPTESPEPAVTPEAKPINVNQHEPIPSLDSQTDLSSKCLGEKTHTCVLALLPGAGEEPEATLGEPATLALASLAEVAEKHKERKGNLFPFYAIPASNSGAQAVRDALKLGSERNLELVAVNGRRGWFRRFETGKYDSLAVETWIDNIRFGEGSKGKLPDDLLVAESPIAEDPVQESTVTEDAQESATTEEAKEAPMHGEL